MIFRSMSSTKMVNSQRLIRLFLGINIFLMQWIPTLQQVNLALGAKAVQSSTYTSSYSANRAIDGNKASDMMYGSCTHTNFENDPWWRLELPAVYNISNVVITNRGDCCSERLSGAELHIGYLLDNNGNNNPRCCVIPGIAAGATASFTCQMAGRYVNIHVLGASQVASLCEVEVYGFEVPVSKRTVIVKLKFNSSEDLNNPTMRNNILQKLVTFANAKPSVLKVRWSKEPELKVPLK